MSDTESDPISNVSALLTPDPTIIDDSEKAITIRALSKKLDEQSTLIKQQSELIVDLQTQITNLQTRMDALETEKKDLNKEVRCFMDFF